MPPPPPPPLPTGALKKPALDRVNNGMTCPVLNSVGKSPDLNDSLNIVAIFPAIHFADSLSSAELMLSGPDAFQKLFHFSRTDKSKLAKGTLHIRTIWTGEIVFALWLCQQMSEMRGQICQVHRRGKSLILATRDVVNC